MHRICKLYAEDVMHKTSVVKFHLWSFWRRWLKLVRILYGIYNKADSRHVWSNKSNPVHVKKKISLCVHILVG